MKKIFLVIFTVFSVFSGSLVSAEGAFDFIPMLESESSSPIEDRSTKVTFNTNVKKCRILLNGNYQGLSKLTLTNLIDGIYLLRVEKEGYEYQENFISVENGKAQVFYIELKELQKTEDESSQNLQEQSAALQSEQAQAENTVTAGEGL
ncbi:PEGA domain-containing protein [Treponema sp.]|uniref:PEGA domain-containing protein n=1 Tax=Treponema sp. TaxID=166 RepID=UPI00388DAB1B